MTRDEKIEKAIEPLLRMYEEIENELLVEIARHFSINDEFLNSDYWRFKKLEEMGLFNRDIIKFIARYSGKTEREVRKALKQIKADTLQMNNLERLFEDEVLKVNPNVLKDNYIIDRIIENSYNELENTFIELSKKIAQEAKKAYLNVVEKAYLKTSMGTHSYDQAIREALNDLGNQGITTLTYTTTDDNGNVVGIRNYDIEGTVRRETLNAARHLSTDISMEMVKELECEYVKISEHLDCRPKHFDWQGTIVKSEELEQDPINYGEVDGLCGINCRHYFDPYFGEARGNEEKTYTQEECNEAYKVSQKQRYYERGIRKYKRKIEMAKASEDDETAKKYKAKLQQWQSRNKRFTEDNHLNRDYTREYVSKNNTALPIEEEKDQVLVIKNNSFQNIPYDDVTDKILKDATPNYEGIPEISRYKSYNTNNAVFDTKDITKYERKAARTIQDKIGGKFRLIHRIQKKGVHTPDSIYSNPLLFKGSKYFEIKSPRKSVTPNSKLSKIKRQLDEAKVQSKNIIISLLREECDLTNDEAIEQILNCLSSDAYNSWVDNIILVGKDDLIKIYQKKRP